MSGYIKTIYNERERPYTDYPYKLCKYLFERYNMKVGDKLLDVGCGRGDFTKGFKDLKLEIFGLDWEKSHSEILKDIEIKLANIEKGPFPFNDETFDFVFSKSVIEHLWSPEHFIKECQRVLKPGGTIIIMTPDWHSVKHVFYDDYTHHHPYTAKSISDLLKIHNFKNVKSELFYQLPVLWKYPCLKIFSKILQLLGPVRRTYKNKFIRWSRELMILGTGIKNN